MITSIYAALLGLLLVGLSVYVIHWRRTLAVGLGEGEDKNLQLAIRAHGNFIEYVPLALIIIALAELGGASPLAIHGLGASLVMARIAHAIGMARSSGSNPGRALGVVLTFIVLLAGSGLLLAGAW